ncbi:MAG: FAD:protein FMN transferase [Bacteroides sp.]|nr:FAD:protein FMN transferase [Roseburia sp.]MCM1347517.1 FAD:protein FMN transferase [Bacteroides sp.]MCM1422005.1 FAD:protein FMN transferase [Bacteroides sp.]
MEQNKKNVESGRKRKWWHIPFILLLCIGTVYVARTNSAKSGAEAGAVGEAWTQKMMQRCEGTIFGTIYHITYEHDCDLADSVLAVLNEVDNSLSPFNKKSVITAVNNNQDVAVDGHFVKVFTLAQAISEDTGGAFDITVAPLVNAWGFGFKNSEGVSDAMIDSLRGIVGMEKVRLENGKVIKKMPQSMLDCSAIAKGYGVDAVGEYLEGKGIKNYMVEIGGEVRVRGCNPHGMFWKIGITKPEDDSLCMQNDIQQILRITDASMATSGNYRNFYIKDNKRYAHTIDPRTGYPVQHSILSSTVIADDCAVADAYATSFMVLGLDEAKKVLERHKELKAFFIYAVGEDRTAEWYSPSLEELFDK